MLKNFILIAYRNIFRNKVYAFINIGGLAIGMAVATLIALWIHDELSFNKENKNYDRVAQVYQHVKFDVVKSTYDVLPIPLGEELRQKYPDFEAVTMSKRSNAAFVSGDKRLSRSGNFVQPDFVNMMSVELLAGNAASLKDVKSILISEQFAKTMFGDKDALHELITIDNKNTLKISGIYRDFPRNSTFFETDFLGSWDYHVANDENAAGSVTKWDNNSWQVYVQLKIDAELAAVSNKIKDIRVKKDNPPVYRPEFFLFPMSRWHLYDNFYDGVNSGGPITFVWLFGTIGVFVLLLACINFMNLSTARSERRAREVGIRKAIGSVRRQLIAQFLSESLFVTLAAFIISIGLVQLALPAFNNLSQKTITIPWQSLAFWTGCLGFCFVTGLVAGSYPALYLSSFRPIKVLKGTFKAGRFAAVPRKVLVVLQFTVSIILIIGTVVVFRQVHYAKDRPIGYNFRNIMELKMTPDLQKNFAAIRTDLIGSGAVSDVSASSSPLTEEYGGTTNISWRGKADGSAPLLIANNVTWDYGHTLGWKLKTGRDFSRAHSLDTAAMILNERAVALMGFNDPLGQTVRWNGREYSVIGVVNDIVRESPFSPAKPGFYTLASRGFASMHIALGGNHALTKEVAAVESVFRKYNPNSPFDFSFVSQDLNRKFNDMERVGKLAAVFSILAILISCLGLFGMASFVAEQRTREIGVRKVLGATIVNIWRLLSKEFVLLVLLSIMIATPIAWYYMSEWLTNYEYRTTASWWIFVLAGAGAVTITLLTVSFQAIRAALANPVKSLRTE